MTLARPTEAELLAFSLGCDVADLPPQHVAQHAVERATLRRDAEQAAAAERNEAAIAVAAPAWAGLSRTAVDGRAYLRRRGISPRDCVELEERDLVRYPHAGIAVALRDETGRISNVVTRWIDPRTAKITGLRECPTAGTLVGCVDQITGAKLVIVAEGVLDSLIASLAWPDAVVLGAHGCGNYAGIARIAAPRVRLAAGRLLLAVHEDEAGERAGYAAGCAAIAAGLSMRSSLDLVRDMPDEANDLADAWALGWRPQR